MTSLGKIAFCFPGQGSLEEGMGRDIAQAVPEAMEVFEAGTRASGLDLKQLCFDDPLEGLFETEVQQPALVTASLAVLAALTARGIRPDYVVGHSVGEYAALAAVEAMDTETAIALVRERGIATAEAAREHPGAMAAILGLDDAVVEEICAGIPGVWPANYNCPGQIVVSGETAAVEQFIAAANEAGARRAVTLKVSGAFHSPLVQSAAARLRPAVEQIRFAEPRVPFFSTVTAKSEGAAAIGALLIEQLVAPVKFTQSVGELLREGVTTFVEVGPGTVLSGLVKRIDRSVTALSVNNLAALGKLEQALAAGA